MMKKRLTALIICVSIVLSLSVSAFAESEAKVYTLSLEDAINMALEKDSAYVSADLKIKDAEKQLQQANKNKKDVQGISVKVSSGISGFLLQRGYYVEQAKIGVESAKLEKQQILASDAYAITQQYYGVKLAERLLKSAENSYKLALDNNNTMEKQYSLGLVSQLDLNNAKHALNQAKAACDKYKRSMELAVKNLAATIFIEEDNYILNLTDDIEYIEFATNIEDDINKALETRYDVYMLKSALLLAQKMENIADIFGYTSAEFSSANQNRVQSEVTYNKTKKLIGIAINASYNEILDAKDSLTLAEEKLNLSKQEYDIAVIQYNLGLITNSQLTAAINAASNAGTELENAKLAYKLAVEKYGYEITIGLGQ